jgi:hypothetical protein
MIREQVREQLVDLVVDYGTARAARDSGIGYRNLRGWVLGDHGMGEKNIDRLCRLFGKKIRITLEDE